jgi:hypothetical protein
MGCNLFDYRTVTTRECVEEVTAVTQESLRVKCVDLEEKCNALREENIALKRKLELFERLYECTLRDLTDLKGEVSKCKSDTEENLVALTLASRSIRRRIEDLDTEYQ